MRPLLPALLCLSLLAFPAANFAAPTAPISDPVSPNNLRPDILYTHRGEFVQVSPMRPLTLNAHVEQFAYDPLGLEIAFVGSEPQGENTLHFVKTVDARTGHELSRLTLTASAGQAASFRLLGFSASGKYLLLEQLTSDPAQPDALVDEYLRWDLSANPPIAHIIDPRSALPPGAVTDDTDAEDASASPDGRRMEFRQVYHTVDAEGKTNAVKTAFFLYDPERDTFKPLNLPPGISSVYSWTDNTHLKIYQDGERKQFDVIAGEISLRPAAANIDKPAVSKQYPDLSLDTQNPKQQDAKGSDGYIDSYLIWIRRTPFGGKPMGAAVAGLMPQPAVAAYPGSDDPTAMWSPTGKQVAFIANHDLYVSDLVTASGAMPREKMAAGLPLDCGDERVLAMSDLKQIGLALVQYAQDFDEHYPPTENIEKTLAPYLKTTDVFSVGSTRWIYHGASNVSLATIESPADTVQATMDLPCAHLVLFFDGHVKAFPKQETGP